MSFMANRKISLYRAITNSDIDNNTYEGRTNPNFLLIRANISASIQPAGRGGKPLSQLPADVATDTYDYIFAYLTKGEARARDVMIDDLGVRYEVIDIEWNSLAILGYKVTVKRLLI